MEIKKGDTIAVSCTVIDTDTGVYPDMHTVMPITDDEVTFVVCENAIMGHVGFTRDHGHFMSSGPVKRKHRIIELDPALGMVPADIMDKADKVLGYATEAALVGTVKDGAFYPGELTDNQTLLITEGNHILDNGKLMSWLSVGRVLVHKIQLNMAIEINAKLILIVKPRDEYSLTAHKIFDITKWSPPTEEAA